MFEKVAEIISEQLSLDIDAVKFDSNIIDDLGADSLDVVELMMALEEEAEIEIPDDIILTFHTVGDVVNYLESINQ